MKLISKTILLAFILISLLSCQHQSQQISSMNNSIDISQEKSAILHTINSETKAAFTRDYEGWKSHWIQEQFVTKTYMNFSDDSMSETIGWKDINQFIVTYFKDHPEPDPLPDLIKDISVRVYGNGAWVTYEVNEEGRGRKKEARLMEKVDGKWKIAGMQTTIYGVE